MGRRYSGSAAPKDRDTKWAVDAGSRTFFVYEASRAEAIRRVSALVPPGTALTTKPWVEDDYPIVYIDGRAAPGA